MSHWNLWCVTSVWSGAENREIHINTLCTGEDSMGFFRPAQTSKWLTVFPELGHKLVSWLVQQRGYIVIQRIHVLHKPFISFIVHLSKNSDRHCLSTKNAFMCFYMCKKNKNQRCEYHGGCDLHLKPTQEKQLSIKSGFIYANLAIGHSFSFLSFILYSSVTV